MRRHERQISDDKLIEKILTKAMVCWVAFHGGEYPYVVPMNYGYKDGALFFHCATAGKKLELIRKKDHPLLLGVGINFGKTEHKE